MSETQLVNVSRVSHYFGEGDSRNQVLFDNSLQIPCGQLVILTGPSGSGKTTLLTLIGALRSVQEGAVQLFGQELKGLEEVELSKIRRGVGFIFQQHNLFEPLTAFENVKIAMQLSATPVVEVRKRGAELLARLGLGHRIDYKPKALSGGQRQRVAIARALVNRPKIVLADEPTAALDKDATTTVLDLLKELARDEGSTILIVTHDSRILQVADRIVNMVDGRITSDVVIADAVRICEFLRKARVFSDLSPTDLTYVSEKMRHVHRPATTTIVQQGDPGTEFFLIVEGRAEVIVGDRKVAMLKPGDFFGEAALISGEPRNATVVSTSEVELYSLDKQHFLAALDLSESFREQILKVYFQRQ